MLSRILAVMGVIAVFNQKGGVGKTTTALNLLATIAQRRNRPFGIDLDPQAQLSHIFGLQPRLAEDSIYSFFTRGRPLAEVAQITRSGVVLCPAHLELAKVDSLLGKSVSVVTKLRRALHDRDAPPGPVVIDCCTLLNVLTLNAIFACDLLLVPISSDLLSLRGALEVDRALNALEPVFKRRLPRRYLLTRYDVERPMSDDVAERMATALRPDDICATRIRESVKIAESPAAELDIFRHAPGSEGAQDYEALGDELQRGGFVS